MLNDHPQPCTQCVHRMSACARTVLSVEGVAVASTDKVLALQVVHSCGTEKDKHLKISNISARVMCLGMGNTFLRK